MNVRYDLSTICQANYVFRLPLAVPSLSLSVAIALSLPSFSLDNSISLLISRFLKLALSPPSIRIIYIILVFIRAFRCTYHVNIQCAQYVIAYVQGLNNVEIILQ